MDLAQLFANAAARILDKLWPAHIQQHLDNAYLLAVLEEQRETWEPGELPKSSAGAAPTPLRVVRPRQTPNPEYNDLPTKQVLSARINDDDVDFWSDMLYLRDLKIEIFAHASIFGPTDLKVMPDWPPHPDFFKDAS